MSSQDPQLASSQIPGASPPILLARCLDPDILASGSDVFAPNPDRENMMASFVLFRFLRHLVDVRVVTDGERLDRRLFD